MLSDFIPAFLVLLIHLHHCPVLIPSAPYVLHAPLLFSLIMITTPALPGMFGKTDVAVLNGGFKHWKGPCESGAPVMVIAMFSKQY